MEKDLQRMTRILLEGPTPEEVARFEEAKRQMDEFKRSLDVLTAECVRRALNESSDS